MLRLPARSTLKAKNSILHLQLPSHFDLGLTMHVWPEPYFRA